MKKSLLAHTTSIAVCAFGILGLAAVYQVARWQIESSWSLFLSGAKANVERHSEQTAFKLDLIVSSLRTMSLLPGVREIERHGENLDANSNGALQQVYNNLALQVDVSEVYIIPADFNPQRLDPATGKPEEPIIMFDEMIIGAGKFAEAPNPFAEAAESGDVAPEAEEVEFFEYEELAKQVAMIRADLPVANNLSLKSMPVYASAEVITCDNRDFIRTKNDKDRQGIMFAVPFFRVSGEMAGTVVAIIRSNAIRAMLPDKNSAIKTPKTEFRLQESSVSLTSASEWSPSLLGESENVHFELGHAIPESDPEGVWEFKTRVSSESYYASSEFQLIRSGYIGGSAGALGLSFLGLMWARTARRRNALVKYRATHDSLTELPNRRVLEDKLKDTVARAKRGHLSFVFYLDLDRFKAINDTMGHQVGDAVIKEAANRIRTAIRDSDVLARIGGDEFVVLLNDSGNGVAEATRIAERIISSFNEAMLVDGRQADVGVSIGIAAVGKETERPEDIIRHADLALFRAKTEERGSYRFYDQKMDEERLRRQSLAASLKEALEKQQFEVHYQEIVDAKTAAPKGCEALLRWRHPELGLISPLEFIPLAEETGLINAIGNWVLQQACIDAMKLPGHYHMAVNVSSIQIQNRGFPLQVVAALNKSGLNPDRLELEFTESVFLSASPETRSVIDQIKACGVNIALDDFGVGFSSLGYLTQYEFDRIKLDRSFMRQIENRKDEAILKAMAGLGTSLGIAVTAEGVETQAQLQAVRAQGCTDVQGYLFSKPQSLEALLKELNSAASRRQV